MPSYAEMLAALRLAVRELDVAEVRRRLDANPRLKLIDVREIDEYAAGRLPGAASLPRGFLEMRVEERYERADELVLYCAVGVRSLFAAKTLLDMGYTNVASMAGGYNRWHDAAFPVEKPQVLTAGQRERYRRHLVIPEVGDEGQAKLLAARVLIMGAGGLGSPAALYLAAAGVGTIGIVDMDVVDVSNLQRQVLHTHGRAGRPKTESAQEALRALNPDVTVIPFQERLDRTNAVRILGQFDLVVDGGDNFPTRYLLNDACVLLNKPNVHGSVFRFEGQVTTFVPRQGPCYRCLYPSPPPPDLAPSCAEAGVLGVLPGVVGLLQANEAIKLVLGLGTPLRDRLLTFDALATHFREIRIRRDPACPVCSEGARVELIDYEAFCANAPR